MFAVASSRKIFGLKRVYVHCLRDSWLIEGEWANMQVTQVNWTFVSVPAETMGFVDKLFECLTTKNYLGIPAVKEPPKEEVKPAAVKPDVVEVRARAKWILLEIKYFPIKISL